MADPCVVIVEQTSRWNWRWRLYDESPTHSGWPWYSHKRAEGNAYTEKGAYKAAYRAMKRERRRDESYRCEVLS